MLARRGVATPEAAELFLRPSVEQLHDPFLLTGLPAAVDRLLAAREQRERVAVVGDYDVDGVTSTALLLAVFGAVGISAQPILPHRLRDGYGLQSVHVQQARQAGCSLIVTVDCGTTAATAVTEAHAAGLDVVITDHHLPGDVALPPEALLINPRQEGCTYPFGDLAAVGLALKLALAVAQRCGRELEIEALLRIACLGTIADVVPLVGENRVIAALGLEALGRTRSEGLRALFQRAGLTPPFSATDVGYRIGPRLNAAGRLDDANRALELLLTRDSTKARELAEDLEIWNRQRQQEEQRVVEEAREELDRRSPLPPIAMAWRRGWHRGVVGIAAGRLARDLNRPTLLLALEEDSATGSGRSIRGIDLHGFLAPWESRLERFGGHAQAVGLTVGREHLESLKQTWEEAASRWPSELLRRRFEYELEVPTREVGEELLAELNRLEPHGQGNPRPLLRVGPLELAGPPRHFGRGHLSAEARGTDGGSLRLLGWGWGKREATLAATFEVLGFLEADSYRGGVQLRLADARAATEPGPPDPSCP